MESPLFADAEDSNKSPEPTRSEVPLFFPTNLPNLLHFLSRGYLAPRECFGEDDKYFEDLLVMAPGRIPLFTSPISEEVVDLVQRESQRTARPVFVELDASNLVSIRVSATGREGNRKVSLDSGDFAVAAPPTVISANEIRCIHFLNDGDLKMASRRRLGNVRKLPSALTRVSPSLQDEAGVGIDALQSWFSSLKVPSGPSSQEFKDVDKAAGAAALMAYADLELSEEVLHLLEGRDRLCNRVPPWISLEISGLTSEDRTADTSSDHTADEIIYNLSSSVLRKTSPRSLRPRKALEKISGVIDESDELSEKDRDNLQKGVGRIGTILANEAPFDGVKSDKYPALQGLMFFLIKEKPEALFQWSPADTGASVEAHLASAAYCGMVYGHASLPLEFRPEPLDEKLSEWATSRLAKLPSEVEESDRSAEEPQGEESRAASERLRARLLERGLESEGPLREAALELCRKEGWTDCVTTLVFATNRNKVETKITKDGGSNRKLAMAWRIPGPAEIRYELDVNRFRSRIKEEEIAETLEDISEQYPVQQR